MFSKKEIFSIPNILCYLRILLVPVFIYVYFNVETNGNHYISLAILTLSSLTDFLDGFIARNFNMITQLGKLIDPIADKLTQITVACTLVYTYSTYIWLIVIILVKDFMLLLVGLHLLKKTGRHLAQAELPGKIATCVFFIVSIILLAVNPGKLVADVMIYTSFALMVVAMIYYARDLYRLYQA